MTAVTVAPKKGVGRGRGRRMTSKQQIEAAALWALGTHTLEALGRRYGKSKEALNRLFKRMGVAKGSHAAVIENRVEEELKRRAEEEATEIALRIKDTREDAYRLGAALHKIEINIITENRKAKGTFASINGEMLAIRNATAAAQGNLRLRFDSLGVKNNEAGANADLPKLVIEEMSAEQASAQRAAHIEEEIVSDEEGAIDDLEETMQEPDHEEDDHNDAGSPSESDEAK